MNDTPTLDSDVFNESLSPYYVHVLLNPLKINKVFYVCKGTGLRAGALERDADRLLANEKRKPKQQDAQEKNS
jgi:hypothetical protein